MSVSAAAPRTAAPSPNSDARTSHPDQADESTRSLSTFRRRRRATERAGRSSHRARRRRRRRGSPPTEAKAEITARLGEACDHGFVTELGATDELGGDAARPAAGCDDDPGPPVIASRPTKVSTPPAAPHLQGGPAGSTVMCPNSPPKPCAPRKSSPSMKMPPPTPTSPKTHTKFCTRARRLANARPAPRGSTRCRRARRGRRGRGAALRSRRPPEYPPSRDSAPGGGCRSALRRDREARRRHLRERAPAPRQRRARRTPCAPRRLSTGRGDERRLSVCTRRS